MYMKVVNGEHVPMTQEEIAFRQAEEAEWEAGKRDRLLKDVRTKRNALLAESDAMMLPDHPADKEAAKAYRKALRDVTKQADLENIEWPVKP